MSETITDTRLNKEENEMFLKQKEHPQVKVFLDGFGWLIARSRCLPIWPLPPHLGLYARERQHALDLNTLDDRREFISFRHVFVYYSYDTGILPYLVSCSFSYLPCPSNALESKWPKVRNPHYFPDFDFLYLEINDLRDVITRRRVIHVPANPSQYLPTNHIWLLEKAKRAATWEEKHQGFRNRWRFYRTKKLWRKHQGLSPPSMPTMPNESPLTPLTPSPTPSDHDVDFTEHLDLDMEHPVLLGQDEEEQDSERSSELSDLDLDLDEERDAESEELPDWSFISELSLADSFDPFEQNLLSQFYL